MRKIEQETYYILDYDELETIIQDEYDISSFDIPSIEEKGNDAYMIFWVEKFEELDEWNAKDVEKIRNGEGVMYSTNTIVRDMANRGIIPFGKYLVSISW